MLCDGSGGGCWVFGDQVARSYGNGTYHTLGARVDICAGESLNEMDSQ